MYDQNQKVYLLEYFRVNINKSSKLDRLFKVRTTYHLAHYGNHHYHQTHLLLQLGFSFDVTRTINKDQLSTYLTKDTNRSFLQWKYNEYMTHQKIVHIMIKVIMCFSRSTLSKQTHSIFPVLIQEFFPLTQTHKQWVSIRFLFHWKLNRNPDNIMKEKSKPVVSEPVKHFGAETYFNFHLVIDPISSFLSLAAVFQFTFLLLGT